MAHFAASYGQDSGNFQGLPEPAEQTANAMVPNIHAPSAERSEYGTYKCRAAY